MFYNNILQIFKFNDTSSAEKLTLKLPFSWVKQVPFASLSFFKNQAKFQAAEKFCSKISPIYIFACIFTIWNLLQKTTTQSCSESLLKFIKKRLGLFRRSPFIVCLKVTKISMLFVLYCRYFFNDYLSRIFLKLYSSCQLHTIQE